MDDSADAGYGFSSLSELRESDEFGGTYGFQKVRRALGVEAFGVNVVVYPPGYEGFAHWHDEQDELYFVHSGRARVEVEDEVREVGPGGLVHVRSTTARKISNASPDEDLVLLVVGGKGGYVERDGHLVDPADTERRANFGR
jgi:mannose-6-phosphate isomerase-like protein (cupin superfamily)